MANKNITIGDFIFEFETVPKHLKVISYIGETGPGSCTTLERKFVVDGKNMEVRSPSSSFKEVLANKKIEKIESSLFASQFVNMPLLKEIELTHEEPWGLEIENCPALEKIIIRNRISHPIDFKKNAPVVRVEYLGGIEEKDKEVSLGGVHTVFGDEVEKVGDIRGGHVTLGKSVKSINSLKKAEMGTPADTTVPEYELPTRIDFLGATPPLVGHLSPGVIGTTEIHIPMGALEAYKSHNQWGKAAYIVEEESGTVIDNYAKKHKERLKKLLKERQEKEAEDAKKAKEKKIKAMGTMMHSTIALQRLAKWICADIIDNFWVDSIEVPVKIDYISFNIQIPRNAPIEIWDKIVAKLESVEAELNR